MWWSGLRPNHHIYGSLLRARRFFITLLGVVPLWGHDSSLSTSNRGHRVAGHITPGQFGACVVPGCSVTCASPGCPITCALMGPQRGDLLLPALRDRRIDRKEIVSRLLRNYVQRACEVHTPGTEPPPEGGIEACNGDHHRAD